MTTIPAMMLWTDAYMADTSHLTTTEHGAYLLILMAMWRAGGTLPADDVRLSRIARLSLDKWRKIAPTILEFMTIENGAISQKRLKLELEIARSKADKAREAGRSGGISNALKRQERIGSDATETPVAEGEHRSSYQNQTKNQKKDSSSLRSEPRAQKSSSDIRFEFEREFWPAYPHKVGKPAALRAFGGARKAASLETILAGLDRYKRDKPADRSWLNPATFLNQQRFLDQPARAGPGPGASPRGRTFAEIARGDYPDEPRTDHTSQEPSASAERSKIPGFAGPLSECDRGDAAGPLFDL